MKTAGSSEMLASIYRIRQCHIPEDPYVNTHNCENLMYTSICHITRDTHVELNGRKFCVSASLIEYKEHL
jgi:hypothetical protein